MAQKWHLDRESDSFHGRIRHVIGLTLRCTLQGAPFFGCAVFTNDKVQWYSGDAQTLSEIMPDTLTKAEKWLGTHLSVFRCTLSLHAEVCHSSNSTGQHVSPSCLLPMVLRCGKDGTRCVSSKLLAAKQQSVRCCATVQVFGLSAVNSQAGVPRIKAVDAAAASLKQQLTGTVLLSEGSKGLGEPWSSYFHHSLRHSATLAGPTTQDYARSAVYAMSA